MAQVGISEAEGILSVTGEDRRDTVSSPLRLMLPSKEDSSKSLQEYTRIQSSTQIQFILTCTPHLMLLDIELVKAT